MTELPFCIRPNPYPNKEYLNDYESYKKGKFELKEWEDVNYCEHSFNMDGNGLTDKEVVDLLHQLSEDNNQLRILVDSLKIENKKLKGRLNDLGVEYY